MKKFALVGNPNSGKTTLFNTLTGSTAHVGNWPGVTVDKKTGIYKKLEEEIEIVDLPGIYSLSPYSPEEIVSRNFIIDEKPDLIINIVDATNLERNLYLTTQILETNVPLIIALNMIDVVNKNGDSIDILKLEQALGVPVVEISALKKDGIQILMEKALIASKEKRTEFSCLRDSYLGNIISDVENELKNRNVESPLFHAIKLIENDEVEKKNHENLIDLINDLKNQLPKINEFSDFEGIVADLRYKYICENYAIYMKKKNADSITKSDKIDRVMTHKIIGIPIFLAIILFVFHLTFSSDLFMLNKIFKLDIQNEFLKAFFQIEGGGIPSIGVWLQSWVGVLFDGGGINLNENFGLIPLVSGLLENSAPWVSGLICDGILSGISSVMSFIPQILVLFLALSILEDSGYMARVAFIMDRAFRRFGLSGKAFMPLLMCFGCGVPGAMATKALENEKERRMSLMIAPFFSCGAKLPIWVAFGSIMFFGQHGTLVVFSMYLIGILVAIISAIILKLTMLKGEIPPFILELPNYHMPQFNNLMRLLWEKLKHFVIKAATIIAGSVVVIWFLSNFGFAFWKGMVDIDESILAQIGKCLRYIFIPAGFGMGEDGWKNIVSAFTGLIAKENVIATMEVLGKKEGIDGIIMNMSTAACYSFMTFNLLTIPCMAMVGAVKGELNSKKKMLITVLFWILTSYIASVIIYWSIRFWFIGLISLLLLALIFLALYLKNRGRKKCLF